MTKAEQLEAAIHRSILLHIRAYTTDAIHDAISRDNARNDLRQLLNELLPEDDGK